MSIVIPCDCHVVMIVFFKQKTAYEMLISDWSSDVCSSDLKKIGESIGEEECMMTKSMALLGTSLVGSMLGMTMPAHAQDAATPQMGVQDILVTARRQEESLQTTPLAVTALGEAALRRSQEIGRTALREERCTQGVYGV